jgi:hypothetical protein
MGYSNGRKLHLHYISGKQVPGKLSELVLSVDDLILGFQSSRRIAYIREKHMPLR